MRADVLDAVLRIGGVPIVGVSIGNPADRSTWRVDFADGASEEQREYAANVISTLDVGQATHDVKDQPTRMSEDMTLAFQAIVIRLLTVRLGRSPTAQEVSDEISAIYHVFSQLRPL